MRINLARYLGKTVYVSIPALFEDGVGRPFRLVDAECNGLWLQSDELTRRLAPDDESQLASMSPWCSSHTRKWRACSSPRERQAA